MHSSNASDVHDRPSATVTGDQAVVSLVTLVITHSLSQSPAPPNVWRGRMSEKLVGKERAVARRAKALTRRRSIFDKFQVIRVNRNEEDGRLQHFGDVFKSGKQYEVCLLREIKNDKGM